MMKKKFLKIQKLGIIILVFQLFLSNVSGQLKDYQLTEKGDTLNGVDKKGQKQGKWVIRTAALRGEPGFDDEGIFKDGKKEGKWRRYNLTGDLIATEYYKYGGKDGVQQYFTMMGDIVRQESWHSYNPDAPYDTIPIYGVDNNTITEYKIVKATQYSVKHGEWKFFEPGTGRVIKTENYDRGALVKDPVTNDVATDAPKKKVKPKEVLEFEKKNSGKKKVKLREGQTGY